MSPVMLFALLLILTFGVLLYFLKPTAAETAVRKHLEDINTDRAAGTAGTTTILKAEVSSNPWLDALAKQLPGSTEVSRLIKQSGKQWPVSSLFAFSALAALVGWWLASFAISNWTISGCIGLAFALCPYLYLWILREVRFGRFDTLLPEAVDLMSRGLRAGHAISAVLEMVGKEVADPVGSEFRAMAEEQSLGIPMREGLLNLVERVPSDDVRFLSAALLLQKETGGNLVQILDKTAAVMRERSRLRGQLKIYTAQGRITGWILCVAPFAMFGLISIVNRDYEKVLFTSPSGLYMVYTGLAMMLIGVLIIRKIIDIKV
jgi:tight adherence protein B